MDYPIGKIIGIEGKEFFGTGFLFHSNNIVLTCDHVILDAKKAKVEIGFEFCENGKVYPLVEARGNAVLDFRFLYSKEEIAQNPLQPGDFKNLEPTNLVSPLYFHYDKADYVKEEKEIRACGKYNNGLGNLSFLEFKSEEIMEGASGGPVLNKENEFIGIVSQLFKEKQFKVNDEYKVCKAYGIDSPLKLIEYVLSDMK